MTAVAFDTLKLARKLRDGAIVEALAEAMSGAELATKADLSPLATKTDRAEAKALPSRPSWP